MRPEQLALTDLVNFRIMTFIDFAFDPMISYNMSEDEPKNAAWEDAKVKKVGSGHDAISISIFLGYYMKLSASS